MDLAAELAGHLFRLKIWSGLSLVAGIALMIGDRRSGFAAMTLGWAVINLMIVWASGRGAPPTDVEAFRRFLGLNLVLNCVWIGIGMAMARNRGNPWVGQAGLAMIVQGAVLQALDLFLYVRVTL
ncbi:hypothetical protein EON79_17330 [bacterium]|nr:MAG: hypothetical protein EON79_17330 [bacterium]